MTACLDWNNRLLDLALGALGDPQARAVEAHVRSCAACAAALDQLRARAEAMDAALDQLAREVQPPLGFPARLLATLEARSTPVPRPWWSGRMAEAALLALVVAGILTPSPAKWELSRRQQSPRTETTLSAWRSPTEGLLCCSGDEFRSTPRLGQFYFGMEPFRDDTNKKHGGNKDES